jgi:amino acid adenylation domain-containing protein
MPETDPFPFDPVLVHEWLERSAARSPAKTALVCGGDRWTYAQLDGCATRLARSLGALGLRPGDRVLILLDNSPETVAALYGTLKAGGVFSVLSATLKAGKLRYILRNSGARVLIAHASKAEVVGEALAGEGGGTAVVWVGGAAGSPPRACPGPQAAWADLVAAADGGDLWRSPRRIDADLAALIYTSGSTGEPKGVMSSHRSMVSAARSIVQYIGNRPDDVILDVLPLSFDYGLYQVLMAMMFGGTVVIEKSFLYLHRILERISAERVTGFPIVPTVLTMLLKMQDVGQYDFSTLRYMTNTGAALPVEHIRKLRQLFPHIRLFSMFGLTECKRVCYLPPAEVDRRPASVGKAIPNSEALVVDEEGRETAPGEVGELIVRGANVMQGYWGDPELTARTYRIRPGTSEVHMYSGDYFKRDEEGFLYFLGRKDDMIKTRGERVSPKEVENILCELPGVLEAAVIGVPDETLGRAVKAFVVAMPGRALTEKDVLRHCAAHMEVFMVPKHVEFMDSLPKTANGKTDKKALKQDPPAA